MTVKLQPCPDWGFAKGKTVELEDGGLDKAYMLLKPTNRIPANHIGAKGTSSRQKLLAIILIRYTDGSKAKLYVRDLGVNPLAVSFDDDVYYWAASDPDSTPANFFRLLNSEP
jgi:hypothetical protein